ncbi:type IV toxin-antitoxin system AbiEi family antitoxin [Nocardia sp. NPDC058499]|uniref:type IV toxin-antitoxin system AbiEi family antitoxin n=1 Tax=Nocardia sp. NPDC058499 TaxID=3346530 RepID=UPI00365B8169
MIAPYITNRTAGNFRDAGLDYVDQAGNAHLSFGPVLIDIRGRPRPTNDQSSAPENIPRATAANLFSARRMQVLFVLLAWPNAARMPVRTIADAAGTSVGITQSTLTTMRENDYLIGKNLHRRDELIDLWTAAFRGTLLPRIRQNSFSGEIESRSLPPGYLISGESAVENIRRPHTLVVYAERFDAMVAVENGWRKSDAPNIEIRRKFWSELSETPSGPRKPFAGSAAPPVLVYADLLTANEPRQAEVARTLRKDQLV